MNDQCYTKDPKCACMIFFIISSFNSLPQTLQKPDVFWRVIVENCRLITYYPPLQLMHACSVAKSYYCQVIFFPLVLVSSYQRIRLTDQLQLKQAGFIKQAVFSGGSCLIIAKSCKTHQLELKQARFVKKEACCTLSRQESGPTLGEVFSTHFGFPFYTFCPFPLVVPGA